MSRINFVPQVELEGLQNAIIRNKKKLMPITGFAKRIETYDDIVSIPSNAEGQISVVAKGLTKTNLLGDKGLMIHDNNSDGVADGWNKGNPLGTIYQVTAEGQLLDTKYPANGIYYDISNLIGRKLVIRFSYKAVEGITHQIIIANNENKYIATGRIITKTDGVTAFYKSAFAKFTAQYKYLMIGSSDSGDIQYATIVKDVCLYEVSDAEYTAFDSLSDWEKDVLYPAITGTKSTLCAFRIRTKDDADNVISEAYVIAKDPETNEILQLRSLPNGTKDEICVTEGKHIQRVGVKTNVASGTVINYSDMATGGQFVAYAADGTMQVGAKGDTLTITAVMLLYQLATPIVTQADVYGDLKAFPGGTIYFEPTLWGFINFDYGQNSKTITTPDVPIGSIRKVVRFDVTDDGRLVETDVTADCTHNGTTLTIANAEPRKTYFYDCEVAPGYYTSAEKIIDVGTHEGVVEHDYGAAAADWVLSTNEALATMLVCTNAGGAAKIIAPAIDGKMYIIRNVSGQTITIKTASSTGITVANGKTATVIFYNTDFIKIGEV